MDVLGLSGKCLQFPQPTAIYCIALGRARWHHRLIALRTHAQAQRDPPRHGQPLAGGMSPLEESEGRALEHLFGRIRKAAGSERV